MVTYQSSRGHERGVQASYAILKGIAADGGLYVPSEYPKFPNTIEKYAEYSYQDLAKEVLSLYLTDFTEQELEECVKNAYGDSFDTPLIAPTVKAGQYYFLELFHGPTYAFKDMALQILPELMKVAMKKQAIDKKVLILTATSGDTGKAAMEGFADVSDTAIMVYYPKDGVSFIQERQMTTQVGDNVDVIGIKGNFDDAQSGVKKLFSDPTFVKEMYDKGYLLSSANSINIGRLMPQIVYYVYAYVQLCKSGELSYGEKMDVVVPTGNFGNILAGYYAKKMGLPIGILLSASNENKVISDFMKERIYNKNREMHLTKSPSMDILVSSNLERLLYDIAGAEKVETYMDSLQREGKYEITQGEALAMQDFYGDYAKHEECEKVIAAFYEEHGYLMDTHTAVAVAVAEKWQKKNKTLIVSTASPYKFASAVLAALGEKEVPEDFHLAQKLYQKTGKQIPEAIAELKDKEVRFQKVIHPSEMKNSVYDFVENLSPREKRL